MVKHFLLGHLLAKNVVELEGVFGGRGSGVARIGPLADVIKVPYADVYGAILFRQPHAFKQVLGGANSSIDLNLRHVGDLFLQELTRTKGISIITGQTSVEQGL